MLSSSRPTCQRRAEAGRSSRAMKSLRNSLTVNVISASAVLEPDCSVWRWAAVAMTRNARRGMNQRRAPDSVLPRQVKTLR